MPTELDRAFDIVVRTTADRLAARGYKRRGSIVRTIRENMSGLLQFQRSTKSTRDRIVFTVNVAVICGDLLPSRVPLRTATSMDAHAGDRLGQLSTGQLDKWWELDASTDVQRLAREIADAAESSALPYIEQYMTPDALIAAWEAGRHLGSTEGQRQDRLARLKAKRNEKQA